MTNSPGAMESSKIRLHTAKGRRLREQLDAKDAHCHHLRIQLCSLQVTLDIRECSDFAAEYYCSTNEQHRLPSDTNNEGGVKKGCAPDNSGEFPQRN